MRRFVARSSPPLWAAALAIASGIACAARHADPTLGSGGGDGRGGSPAGIGGSFSDGGRDGGSPLPDASSSGAGGNRDAAVGDAALDADANVPAGTRTKAALPTGWRFLGSNTLTGAEAAPFDDRTWATVSVPHTWDSVAASSNRLATFSHAWYRTTLPATTLGAQERLYILFEGVFQVADVYLNGQHLGQHRGGYTRFIFDATPALTAGANVLAVQVSNADCADCLPDGNTRLFKGYGGIYRKVWLLRTHQYHVATTDFASSGVYVTASNVTAASAAVSTRILLSNDGAAAKTFTVDSVIRDGSGRSVLAQQSVVPVAPNVTVPTMHTGAVSNPRLWGPSDPYLYSITVSVTVDGALTDQVVEPIGFRSYQLTTTDFTLNGTSTRLRGVSKHQETEHHATAVSDVDLIEDWDNLRDLGVNFVRLVHYPHAQLEHDLADQRGMMVWCESGHTNGGPPTPNGDNLVREMVYQNWNHPSIIFWSAGNEASGVAASTEYANVIHAADPSRPVVYASNGQSPGGVTHLFQNTYAGWYGGTMYDWLTSSDHWISETGAGMAVGTHTPDPFATTFTVNSFEPEEYGALVNEVRFDDLVRNPTHVPAFAGWVFRDISDVKYKNLLNTKGLITFAGYKKDVFFHYKSLLQKSPVTHLVAPHYFLRRADANGQGPVKVYSNAATLTLTVGGQSNGAVANNRYTHPNGTPVADVFLWPDALRVGKNAISVSDGLGHSDAMTVYYLGTGTTLPADPAAKVQNLTSTVGPAYFIDAPIADQRPFYYDFDGSGDNTFDVVPPAVVGAGWIATRRQSDPAKRTNLAFDLPSGADVFIMFTTQATVPAWISAAGFADTGVAGQWRDNGPKLVAYSLYERRFAAGSHVALASSAIDYVLLIK